MCCNGSKRTVPALHAVAPTWSSCVELPVQHLFPGISAALNLTIYGVTQRMPMRMPQHLRYLHISKLMKLMKNGGMKQPS